MLLLCCSVAHAATKRVAIVVGNNAGAAEQTPLRFAEADAGKIARVLVELGGVAPEDLFLLQGKTRSQLGTALDLAKKRIVAHHRDPANRVVVMVYFSGHSDGEALELGTDRWAFADLKHWLAQSGADVRVGFVDSCKSGALLGIKGGTLGSAFDVAIDDHLASTGDAMLTSSAADEVSLESAEIGGSFFTHHFVSGLRGAADASGDGVVTLGEAYQYAYAHTIVTTSATTIGAQHPSYDYRLSGQGELVLTELTKPSASIEMPAGFDRGLVIDVVRDEVIAEVTAHSTILLAPGRYTVRAWRDGAMYVGRVAVASNERRVVSWDELSSSAPTATTSKGGSGLLELFIAGGVQRDITTSIDSIGPEPSARIELRSTSGLTFSAVIGSSDTQDGFYRATQTSLLVGYRRGLRRGAFSAWVGLDLGGVLEIRTAHGPDSMNEKPQYTPGEVIAPTAGLSLRLDGRASLGLVGTVATMVTNTSNVGAVVAPAAWLGFSLAL